MLKPRVTPMAVASFVMFPSTSKAVAEIIRHLTLQCQVQYGNYCFRPREQRRWALQQGHGSVLVTAVKTAKVGQDMLCFINWSYERIFTQVMQLKNCIKSAFKISECQLPRPFDLPSWHFQVFCKDGVFQYTRIKPNGETQNDVKNNLTMMIC